MMTALRLAHVRSLRCQRPPRTSAWPSRALAKRFGRTGLISSDDCHHQLDVTCRNAGMGRQCENARGDFASPLAGLLMTCEVWLDAGNIADRSRIRRARADSCVPEPAEQT